MEVKEKETRGKNKQTVFFVIIALLLLGNGVLVWQLLKTKSEVKTIIVQKDQTQDKNAELQLELDSLLSEHERIKSEYDDVEGQLTEKDSIILANAERIRNLISRQADYNKIKKDLKLLREMTQGYVTQLDSLYTENKVLKAENVRITNNYKSEVEKTTELTKEKEELVEKVTTASKLKAYRVSATPIHVRNIGNKEKVTDKARKTDNIKVCFTLSENKLVEVGTKDVYVRIVAPPSNKILTKNQGNTFVYNGETIQYTIKKQVSYQQKAQDLCMYWYQNDDFVEGNYSVEVFVDGYRIGTTGFSLR